MVQEKPHCIKVINGKVKIGTPARDLILSMKMEREHLDYLTSPVFKIISLRRFVKGILLRFGQTLYGTIGSVFAVLRPADMIYAAERFMDFLLRRSSGTMDLVQTISTN